MPPSHIWRIKGLDSPLVRNQNNNSQQGVFILKRELHEPPPGQLPPPLKYSCIRPSVSYLELYLYIDGRN